MAMIGPILPFKSGANVAMSINNHINSKTLAAAHKHPLCFLSFIFIFVSKHCEEAVVCKVFFCYGDIER